MQAHITFFMEIVTELSKMDQKDVDSIMDDDKDEIVSWHRGIIDNVYNHIRKERFFGTALFLMTALVEFEAAMSFGKKTKAQAASTSVTFPSFMKELTNHFAGNDKFFSEICITLFHAHGSVFCTGNVHGNGELWKHCKNKKHSKNRFLKSSTNNPTGLTSLSLCALELSIKTAFLVDIIQKTPLDEDVVELLDKEIQPSCSVTDACIGFLNVSKSISGCDLVTCGAQFGLDILSFVFSVLSMTTTDCANRMKNIHYTQIPLVDGDSAICEGMQQCFEPSPKKEVKKEPDVGASNPPDESHPPNADKKTEDSNKKVAKDEILTHQPIKNDDFFLQSWLLFRCAMQWRVPRHESHFYYESIHQ